MYLHSFNASFSLQTNRYSCILKLVCVSNCRSTTCVQFLVLRRGDWWKKLWKVTDQKCRSWWTSNERSFWLQRFHWLLPHPQTKQTSKLLYSFMLHFFSYCEKMLHLSKSLIFYSGIGVLETKHQNRISIYLYIFLLLYCYFFIK